MKKYIYALIGCLVLVILYSCQKDNHQTDFKNFLDGHELVYTGTVGSTITQPGNLEVGLKWKASSDPSITKYVVYYNNKADSQVVNITAKSDTIRTVIKGLSEYTYSFTIYSFDAKGNKSIPTEVNNVKIYGPVYISNLLNRGYDAVNPFSVTDDDAVTLNFIKPDTINVGTTIKYTNKDGVVKTVVLKPDSSSITLSNYKAGTDITYNSSYIPERNAIDVFNAPKTDVFPKIFYIKTCDKSLFRKAKMPYDMNPLESGTDVEKLWNGATTPQPYPNIFHNDGSTSLPSTLTFDMGKKYNHLTQIEEIGRNCCHNPNDFEIWGIADTTNATTTIAPNDPAWKAQSIAKGWKLLKEVVRTDDGSAPLKTNFDAASATPIRFIRIRILHNSDNDNKNTNLTQITLFYDAYSQ